MNDKKLCIKDLVTIGIFSVIYTVMSIGIGMIGMIPILYLITPIAVAIICGPVVMLFMAKVQKPWAIFIFGAIIAVVPVFMGYSLYYLAHGVAVALIAELVRRSGGYSSFKANATAYAVESLSFCGYLMQVLWLSEYWSAQQEAYLGADYVKTVLELITYPHMAVIYALTIVAGFIGAYFGRLLLKKHFEKAGII